MRSVRRLLVPLAALTTLVLLAGTPAAADPGPPPNSMASLGDSITRGFNACGWYVDCTSRSFSTGDTSTVDSQGVDYVTMLIGANDACTGTEAAMTPVATYRANIDAALSRLKTGLPTARVQLISVPDIHRLWSVGKGSGSARSAWSLFSVCQSMLANPTSTAQADVDRRNRVRQRVVDYNTQLAQACAAYGPNCDFDDNAVFGYPFTLSQLSTWDYFHPNTSGQQVVARVSYAAGFGW
ncbi:GDSL-type esterase/lipase family protein [Micromonospora sp. NPDC048170]|uniref:SGNH/GDSL hydrolase family protein n=1 Tax=Micromonospora sp. NPDC048170 TaxID=3154819 RepID=UPI0034021805